MTEEQLEQTIVYCSESLYFSGTITGFEKAKANLYYTGEDDQTALYTMKQLKESFDKEEIERFNIEIAKGDFVIKL